LWEYRRPDEAEVAPYVYGNGNENHEVGTGFIVHKRIISAVKRLEFVIDRTSYIILRGVWCDIIVLKVQVPIEDKTDDIKDRFYEELDHVFVIFPKNNIKVLLGDFIAKVGREDIFKRILNESLHESNIKNGFGIVNFAMSSNLTVNRTMFPHRNIYKFILISPDGKIL
jgi:hypothetical protein